MAYPRVRAKYFNVTLAQMNAGYVIEVGRVGRTFTVVDGWCRANGGSAAAGTGVKVVDSAGTAACEWVVANLTSAAIARIGVGADTATNLGTPLAKGSYLKVIGDGTLTTAANGFDGVVYYTDT